MQTKIQTIVLANHGQHNLNRELARAPRPQPLGISPLLKVPQNFRLPQADASRPKDCIFVVRSNGHCLPLERALHNPERLSPEEQTALNESLAELNAAPDDAVKLEFTDFVRLTSKLIQKLSLEVRLASDSFFNDWSRQAYVIDRVASQKDDQNIQFQIDRKMAQPSQCQVHMVDKSATDTIYFSYFAWRPAAREVVFYDLPKSYGVFFAALQDLQANYSYTYFRGASDTTAQLTVDIEDVVESLVTLERILDPAFVAAIRQTLAMQKLTFTELTDLRLDVRNLPLETGLNFSLEHQGVSIPFIPFSFFGGQTTEGLSGFIGADRKFVASRGESRQFEMTLLRHQGFAILFLAEVVQFCLHKKNLDDQPLKNEKEFWVFIRNRMEEFWKLKYGANFQFNLSKRVEKHLREIIQYVGELAEKTITGIVDLPTAGGVGVPGLGVLSTPGRLLLSVSLLEMKAHLSRLPVKELIKERSRAWESLWCLKSTTEMQTDASPTAEYQTAVALPKGFSFTASAIWDFVSELAGLGVQVTFDKKSIVQLGEKDVQTSVHVADRLSLTQDWFELKPEIYFNGRKIDLDEASLLPGERLMEYRGQLYCFDRRTLPRLQSLSTFWEKILATQAEARKGKAALYFASPKNLTLDLLQLRRKGVHIDGGDEWQRIAAYFDQLKGEDRADQLPADLHKVLLPHQRGGVQWLTDLYQLRLGGLLADEMGLGKTLQALTLLELHRRAGDLGQCLILVPTSLIFNWKAEAERFTPSLPVEEFSRFRDQYPDNCVVIASYGLLSEHKERFENIDWNVIVYDEAHFLKNIKAARTQSARRLKANFKLALTGTPLENNFEEFYSIVDLVLPGALGPFSFFRQKATQFKDDLNSEAFGDWTRSLREVLAPVILRRSKTDAKMKLPEKKEILSLLEMDSEQKRLYKKTAIAMNEEIKGLLQANETQAPLSMLISLLRLRQICTDPQQVDQAYSDQPPKFLSLLEELEVIHAEGESALVFVQFLSSLTRLDRELKKRNLPSLTISGSTPRKDREKILAEFQKDDQPRILVMTLKTGGVGLNLTKANHVFHFEPWWNPAAENQGTDRVHRMGQTRDVLVRRLIMKDTLEERMQAMKLAKQLQFQSLFEAEDGDTGPLKSFQLNAEVFNQLLAVDNASPNAKVPGTLA